MSYPYQMFGNDVPMIRHTDWASVAKQWASLRATVNVGPSHSLMRGDIDLRHIPPPPPPPPSPPLNIADQSQTYSSYIDHENPSLSSIGHSSSFASSYDRTVSLSSEFQQPNTFPSSYNDSGPNYDQTNEFNQSYDESGDFDECYNQSTNFALPLKQNPSNNEPYYQYENYDEINNHDFFSTENHTQQQIINNSRTLSHEPISQKCQTFDYNHGNEEYDYYEPPVTTLPYSQNMWNHPPPDHPDVQLNYHKESYNQPEPVIPKLFPIANDFHNNNLNIMRPLPSLIQSKKLSDNKLYSDLMHDNIYAAPRPTKGLPAWIIDDMKKMKEKEHKRSHHSMDIYKDSHVHSRRDDEGDVVMEDVNRESEIDVVPGKNVTKLPIGNSTTETDIDSISLHDDDEIVPKIDYSSISLVDLIALLDDNEIASLKIAFIRNSLTEVMKEITDDMIFSTVKSMFSRELTKGKKSHKHKGKSGAHDSLPIKQQPEVMSQLLGLDVYESNDDEDTIPEVKADIDSQDFKKENLSTHSQKNSYSIIESDKSYKIKLSRGSKEKTQISLESSKDKHRSRSRDTGKSKDKRRSHKKSKRHNDPEDKWNHDNYEKSRKKH